jgi:hypothetical protein
MSALYAQVKTVHTVPSADSVRHSIGQGGLVLLPPWWGKLADRAVLKADAASLRRDVGDV